MIREIQFNIDTLVRQRQKLLKRLSQHEFNGCINVYNWVKELKSQGIKPKIISLTEHNEQKEADLSEAEWIYFCSQQGMKLLNVQPALGYFPRPENLKYTEVVPVITSTGLQFKSMTDAANYYKISPIKISKAIHRGRQYSELSGIQLRFENGDFPNPKLTYIVDSLGTIFDTIEEVSVCHNLPYTAIKKAIETHDPINNLYFFSVSLTKAGKRKLGFMRKIKCIENDKCFISVSDAARYYNIDRKRIYASLKQGYAVLGLNLHFKYESIKEEVKDCIRKKGGGHSAKMLFDHKGNYFNSIKEAAKFWNMKVDTVIKSARNKILVKNNIQFFFVKEEINTGKEQGIKLITKEGEKFPSITVASKSLKKSYTTLQKLIKSGDIVLDKD